MSGNSKYTLIGSELGKKVRQRALFLLKVDRRIKWMGAGMFCFALFGILSFFPEFTERFYSRGLYIIVRYIYDYSLGLLPFSSTIWLNLLFFMWFFYKVFKYINFNLTNGEVSLTDRIKYTLLAGMSFLGKLSVIFFVGWGFNYQRIPLEDYTRIGLKSLTPQELVTEANLARKKAINIRKKITTLEQNEPFGIHNLPKDLENTMRENLETALKKMGYPAPGRVRCRVLSNDYWLREFGYTGMYVSFYGEALVSENIAAIYRPFFYAHEMAHGMGFFDEADANFLAYMACEQSDDPAIVYSGRIAHLIYIRHEFGIFRMDFPKEIITDLRSNGVFQSQEHYNRMILLVHAWRKTYPFKLEKNVSAYQTEQYDY